MLPGLEDHPHARAVLTAAHPPQGNPNHAYLFHGPAGSGKREVARELAATLLSEGARDPAEAAQRVRSGAHPDLTWVAPSGAAEMLVSDIDEPVVAAATRTPFESRRRVFVIEREFVKAAAFALAGAVLTYFGFMHGEAVGVGHGFGVTPSVAIAYLVVAGFLFLLAKQPSIVEAPIKSAVPAE